MYICLSNFFLIHERVDVNLKACFGGEFGENSMIGRKVHENNSRVYRFAEKVFVLIKFIW